VVQGREQLASGEIAGGAKNDERRRRGRRLYTQPIKERIAVSNAIHNPTTISTLLLWFGVRGSEFGVKFAVHGSRFITVRGSPVAVHRSLLTVRGSPVAAHRSRFTGRCSPFAVHGKL
jgi:hypothetical protein